VTGVDRAKTEKYFFVDYETARTRKYFSFIIKSLMGRTIQKFWLFMLL
jgi:hypothetical protein